MNTLALLRERFSRALTTLGIDAADLPGMSLPTRELSVVSRAASRRAGLTQLMRLASVPTPPGS